MTRWHQKASQPLMSREYLHVTQRELAHQARECVGPEGVKECPGKLGEDLFPLGWLNSVIRMIPKLDQSSVDPSKWRPITLADTLLKGVSKILRIKALKFLEKLREGGALGYQCDWCLLYMLAKGQSSEAACRIF